MKINLIGHDYKYAVEQIMLALFPRERPDYGSNGETAFSAVSRLSYGDVFAQATTIIRRNGTDSCGISRVRRDRLADKLATDRHLQRIVKQSFYKAAMSFVGVPPVWGSLTGIRPARVAAASLSSGKSEKSTAKYLVDEFHVSPERAKLCLDAAQSAHHVMQSLEPSDIALYVGIPFCPSRCAYCSFVSNSVEKSFGSVDPFVQKLLQEITAIADTISLLGLRIIALYIGGGTPTSIPDDSFENILRTLWSSLDLTNVREYTVEAGRPDTITSHKLELMSRYAVGRVCVNPQSMSDDVLSAIGRRHTTQDTIEAVRLVRQIGLSLNMDVIAGLPGDTEAGFRKTLDAVLDLKPENVTVHTLSLKKGSRIMLEEMERLNGSGGSDGSDDSSVHVNPSGAEVSKMLEYAAHRLRGSGFSPYYLYRQKFSSGGFENTGWTLPGHEGLYNICMMEELCSVLSLGGGAVTKLVSQTGRIERIFNAKYPREYILQANKIADKIEKIRHFYL